jgi:hypothetical protein
MRRGLCALVTAAAVTALGASSAAALETQPPGLAQAAQNVSGVVQGGNEATGGNGTAVGGDGGYANTGNVQALNGNAVSIGAGPKAQASSQGGDTSAKSGDATGGNGGNAKGSGGDATAGNVAIVKQVTSGSGHPSSKKGGDPSNESKVGQFGNEATGGDGTAVGGHGGDANSGNVQVLNGNSVSIGAGPKAKADSKGGDTSAKSGDATGGNGGNAKASGGDATAGNVAAVKQSSPAGSEGKPDHGAKGGDCGCSSSKKGDEQRNESWILQAPNEAYGGQGEAVGGDGGYADSGNVQEGNGNAFAWSDGERGSKDDGCGCASHNDDGGVSAQGGDTSAKSGDAYGGDGGNAKAHGGDATAGNIAVVKQVNASKGDDKRSDCGCEPSKGDEQSNESWIGQGGNYALGGNGEAQGGYGGDANSGNLQEGNGNAWASSHNGDEELRNEKGCGCDEHSKGDDGTSAQGGDTSAKSGDATGGDGGDAKASGGDAVAGNIAKVLQLNV